MALKLDNSLLEELGLAALPEAEKQGLLKHIYETLEMRVGMRLADQMTNEQLDEFEQFVNANDDSGAFKWLESNFPNYKDVVNDEFEKLKAEVGQVAPQILSQSQQALAQGAPAPDPFGAPAPQPQQQPAPQTQMPPQPQYQQQPPQQQPAYQQPQQQPYQAQPMQVPVPDYQQAQPQQPFVDPSAPQQYPPQQPYQPQQPQYPQQQPPAGPSQQPPQYPPQQAV